MRYTKPEIETLGHASELVEVIFTASQLDFEPSTYYWFYVDPYPWWYPWW